MLGTYTHVGGPSPLRAGVSYSYPFGLHAPQLATSEHCLRLPWRQRHAFDDLGAVEHEEQAEFVGRVLREAHVSYRGTAPGEYVFSDAATAESALLALALALGADWI